METKTNWKNLENYDYLGAYSLNGIANDVVLTIKEIQQKEITGEGGVKSTKIVVTFEETNVNGIVVKPMIVNKTNCKTIAKIYNSDFIEDWIGKKIKIYPTTTRFGRDLKPCLRIKEEIPVITEPEYKCEVCGKVIDKKIYMQTKNAYGAGLCSPECKEKYLENKKEKENN